MGKLSQTNRTATLKTPLGDDVLVLKSFSGTEGLGELFEFQVDALSENNNIDFDNRMFSQHSFGAYEHIFNVNRFDISQHNLPIYPAEG